jgi:hypothetical protein
MADAMVVKIRTAGFYILCSHSCILAAEFSSPASRKNEKKMKRKKKGCSLLVAQVLNRLPQHMERCAVGPLFGTA